MKHLELKRIIEADFASLLENGQVHSSNMLLQLLAYYEMDEMVTGEEPCRALLEVRKDLEDKIGEVALCYDLEEILFETESNKAILDNYTLLLDNMK